MFPTILSYLSTVLSTVFSVAALLIAAKSYRLKRFPLARLHEVECQLIDIQDQVDRSLKLSRKLNARLASREAREKHVNPENAGNPAQDWTQRPGESAEEWKKRIRQTKLLQGQRPRG